MKSQAAEQPQNPSLSHLLVATAQGLPEQDQALARARAFAEPLLANEELDTGENTLAHADAVAGVLRTIGGSEAMQAATYLVYACAYLNKPQEVIAKAFGDSFAELAVETTKLVQVQRQARAAQVAASRAGTAVPMAQTAAVQTENVRKMLLAFSRDLRVVMLRLASRLQTLRYFAATKQPVPPGLAAESLQVFAPLARLMARPAWVPGRVSASLIEASQRWRSRVQTASGQAGAASWRTARATARSSRSGSVRVRSEMLRRSDPALTPSWAPRSTQAPLRAFSSSAGCPPWAVTPDDSIDAVALASPARSAGSRREPPSRSTCTSSMGIVGLATR